VSAPTRTPASAWLVWSLAVAAYAVAVFDRASLGVSGVLAQERFGATAAALSLFGVLQLAVYASLQVPVGVLLDRYGSRRLLATGATVMAVGQLLLSEAHSVPTAVLARVLVGAGDAMTFTSVLRLVALWFAARRVPLMTQLTAQVGQFGQVAAAYPLVALLGRVGWSRSFLLAGLVGLAVATVVAVALRDGPPGSAVVGPRPSLAEVRTQLKDAWGNLGTRLGLWTHFVTQFSGTAFALMWGYPFLTLGEGRTPTEAGVLLTLLVVVSMGVGPVLGQLTGRWPYRRSAPVLAIVLTTVAAWTVVLLWPGPAPLPVLVALALVLGCNGPGSMVGFDFARTENPPARLGSATGIVNVGGFVAALVTIAGVGLVLTALGSGAGTSSLGDYRLAMAVQYPLWALGLVGVLRTRRRLRAALGVSLDPLPHAVVRRARDRRVTSAGSPRGR
jgi:MFS family permease